MQRLNKQQIEYAKGRISAHSRKRTEALRKSCTTGAPLSGKDKATLIRTGKVKLRKETVSIGRYDKVDEVFDFSKHGETFNQKTYDKGCEKIEIECRNLIDKLMLGDVEEALKMIGDLA